MGTIPASRPAMVPLEASLELHGELFEPAALPTPQLSQSASWRASCTGHGRITSRQTGSKIDSDRKTQRPRHGADQIAGRIADPVVVVKKIGDGGTESGRPSRQSCRIARTDVEGRPGWNALDVVCADIGSARIDGPRRRRQPRQERCIPFDAQVTLQIGGAYRVVSVVEVPFRLRESGVEIGQTAKDANAGRHLAERI